MAVAVLDSPRHPKRCRDEADVYDYAKIMAVDRDGADVYDYAKIMAVDRDGADGDWKESEEDDDGCSEFMAVDRAEADDDGCSAKIMPDDDGEIDDDVGDIVRYCGDFLCKEPHTDRWFGGPLWDVISIKIRRNMKYHDPEVRIHGAIRVNTLNHFTDYLFKRGKADAQVFENPGEVLTLSLVGPHKPWVLKGFSCQPGLRLYGILKYNNEDIFTINPDETTDKRYTHLLKGCPESYSDDDGYWGDFEDYNDLFFGKEDNVGPVGYGLCCLPFISNTNVYNTEFCFRNSMLDKVASVEAELVGIYPGFVGSLKLISSRDLDLSGTITARSCQLENGIVLFHKTQKEAIAVKSNESIPLSRSMAAVDCRASLVVKVYLQDANDRNFLVDETMQFNVRPTGRLSQKTSSNGAIEVNVEWTYELYDGPRFSFPE